MRTRQFMTAALMTSLTFAAANTTQAAIVSPTNGGFESPDASAFGAVIDDWTQAGNTGVVDGNGGTNYPGLATNQWAVIFSNPNGTTGSIEQSVGTVDAGSTIYRLTFDQSQNALGGDLGASALTEVEILVDGVVVDSYDSTANIPDQGEGVSNEIFDFTLDTAVVGIDAGDDVTVRFTADVDGGQWVFDNVEIAVIPEPGSLALLGLGGLLMLRRRRNA